MTRYLSQLLLIWLITPGTVAHSADALRFDVTDLRETITHEIDPTLQLRVVRVNHSRVAHFGWEVQVAEHGDTSTGNNLLRRGVTSGGPHPSDVLAWLSRERYFPDDRRISVPGYPYEIRIRLVDCRTALSGEDTGFISGSVEITWRRLDLVGTPDRDGLNGSATIQ